MLPRQLLRPRDAYNLAADHYQSWRWYEFWRRNEGPMVRDWLEQQSGQGLDAGCGTAPYINDLTSPKVTCCLLDISEKMLQVARRNSSKEAQKKLHFVQGDIFQIPFKHSTFDFILCTRVLSHANNISKVINEFSRVLKIGGHILITDIHPDHPYEYTRIESPNGPIAVETYKHDIKQTIDEAIRSGLTLDRENSFGLLSLRSAPDRDRFAKIYRDPDKPIFFSLRLTK